jgi:uncharacterized lipoprotein YajG
MTFRKNVFLFVVLCAAVSAAGCAFGTRQVTLSYHPVSEKSATKDTAVVVCIFDDARTEKNVGEVRNSYGIKTASAVLADGQDVGAWAANAVADELANRGYQITKIKTGLPEEHEILIKGAVRKSYVRMGVFSVTAENEVAITVYRKGLPVLDEVFSGKRPVAMGFASSAEFAGGLEGAMQETLKQAIPKIEGAIQ